MVNTLKSQDSRTAAIAAAKGTLMAIFGAETFDNVWTESHSGGVIVTAKVGGSVRAAYVGINTAAQ